LAQDQHEVDRAGSGQDVGHLQLTEEGCVNAARCYTSPCNEQGTVVWVGLCLVWSLMFCARLCVYVYSCLSHGVVGRVWQQAAEGIAASESRRLGVTVSCKDIRKNGKAVRPRSYAIERFRILLPIFDKGLPADLCAAVEHADSSFAMYRSEPALKHLSLICKYGSFKACLFKAWQDHKGQQPSRGLLLHHCRPSSNP
jgi:hypothetical protein